MRTWTWIIASLAGLAACAAPTADERDVRTDEVEVASAREERALEARSLAMPLLFERNDGQAPDAVDFVARGGGYTLLLEDASARLMLHGENGAGHAVRLRCVDGDAAAKAEALEPNRAKVNYLLGGDPRQWQTNVPTFDRVAYRDVYPGIDLVFRGNATRLEFDLDVAPGADPSAITLEIDGAADLRLDGNGDLVATTPTGELRQLAPVCFQDIAGKRVPVESAFDLRDDGSVSFSLGSYDPDRRLVIDPVIQFSSEFGPPGYARYVKQVVGGEDGVAYAIGSEQRLYAPPVRPSPDPFPGGALGLYDAWVAKFLADRGLEWITYFGGESWDNVTRVAVHDGRATLVGNTFGGFSSPVPGGIQDEPPTPTSSHIARFVARLAPDGTHFEFFTFLGSVPVYGPSNATERDYVGVDAAGNTYVMSDWWDVPEDLAVRTSGVEAPQSYLPRALVRISADGSTLDHVRSYAVYRRPWRQTMDVGADGKAYVVCWTEWRPGFWQPRIEKVDLTAEGDDVVVYSRSLGLPTLDMVSRVAVDSAGRAYVSGATAWAGLPGVGGTGGLDATPSGVGGPFVLRLSADGQTVDWTAYFGEWLSGLVSLDIAVDEADRLFIATSTAPLDLPPGWLDPDFPSVGVPDFWVAWLGPDGRTIPFSGYVGSSGWETLEGLSAGSGRVWLDGRSQKDYGAPYPITPNALDTSGEGPWNLWTTRHVTTAIEIRPSFSFVTDGESFHAAGTSFDWTAGKQMRFDVVVKDASGTPATTVLPAGAVYDTGFDPPRFTWTPTEAEVGAHTIVFEATGIGGTTTATLDVTVRFDSDGDALPDLWETDGYTYEDGTLVTLSDLSAYTDRADFVEFVAGADPDHRDVFVWVDWMAAPGDASHASHQPDATALDLVLQSFASGPSQGNPDGLPGVRLHLLVAQQPVAHEDLLGTGDIATFDWSAFDAVSTMPAELTWSFHRALFAHDISTASHSGVSREPGIGKASSDFIVSLGSFTDGVGSLSQQAGTFQHELGHNLGLGHGGGDDLLWKPNYLSVMNYLFQMTGLRFEESYGVFDYSFAALPTLFESDLDEVDGMTGPGGTLADVRWDGYGARWWYPFKPVDAPPPGSTTEESNYLRECGEVNQPIDWNWSDQPAKGQTPAGNVKAADADADVVLLLSQNSRAQVLPGFDDWTNLVFTGGRVGGGISVPLPQVTPLEELTVEQARLIAPAPPGSLRVVAADVQAVLTWKPLGPRKEWNYRVWRAVGEGDPVAIATTQNSEYQDGDAPTGVELTYSITAIDALGVESRASQGVTVTLP